MTAVTSASQTVLEQSVSRALAAFPGGVSNGEYGLPAALLTVMERGEGCRLWDVEGHEFIDVSMGWGSCLVGHARPEVVAAVQAQAARGSNFAFVNDQVLALAEEIQRVSPAARRLRFCASGSEATMYCLRLARGFTGKPKVLKFEGAYHGANEVGVTSLFPHKGLPFPAAELTSAGTPAMAEGLLVAPYNDLATTQRIVADNAKDLAAVIVEPLQRCTPPEPGFLDGLRALCTDHGVLLIFDEVVTGFRLAYGGAQEYYRVIPDLVAYGKALGGGYPIGAFGGRADVMDMVDEARLGRPDYVWMASTLGGNPISTAAANATLAVFRNTATYIRLHGLGRDFRDGLRRVLADRQIPAQVIGDGPLAQIVFSPEPVRDYRSTARGDKALGRATMLGLFKRGVFLNPLGTKLYLSIAHDEAVCADVLDRLDDTLAEVTAER